MAWDAFADSARHQLERAGMSGVPVVVVPSTAPEEDFDRYEVERARECFPEIISALLLRTDHPVAEGPG